MRYGTWATSIWLVILSALCGSVSTAVAKEVAPQFDRVRYAQPNDYLLANPAVGGEEMIANLAQQLCKEKAKDTLHAIWRWFSRSVRYDADTSAGWRPFDQIVTSRSYGSEAEQAVVFGSLARKCGIPAVWVKSVDLDWIEDFRRGRPAARKYRGRVFLEVFIDGKWRLFDPVAMRLYEAYDPRQRILPGGRFAYDKGGDPHALILPMQREAWERQTEAYFTDLDPALLPGGRPTDLLGKMRVYIAGDGSAARYAKATCDALGYRVELSFANGLERVLGLTQGNTLIVTCKDGKPAIPQAAWRRVLPQSHTALVERGEHPTRGWDEATLANGTRVVLVTKEDFQAVEVAVAGALGR